MGVEYDDEDELYELDSRTLDDSDEDELYERDQRQR